MSDELSALTIAEAARLIGARRLSPLELTQAVLGRIERLNPVLAAYVTVAAERALEGARAAEAEIVAGRHRGPLHGIPLGLKDVFETAGLPTTAHSRILVDHVPKRDSAVAAALGRDGAVFLGKHACHEFAHGGPSFDLPWPPARNPWDPTRFTGGSSSGSAAAVAGGLALGAIGTDTGGSVRNPAALCGIVGLKPTYGLVSRRGVIPNAFTFDHCGPMARTTEDCAILLQSIAGHDAGDQASSARVPPDYAAALGRGVKGLRIGVIRHFWEDDLPAGEEAGRAAEAALGVLAGLGASLADARMRPLQDYYDVKITIAESELFAIHQKTLRSRPGDYGADFLARALPACLFNAYEYVQAQRLRRIMLAEMERLYESFDVLVTAGHYGPAPRLDAHRSISFWRKPSITTPFNVTGGPALSLCCGFSTDGLPLALQVIGRPFDEETVLRVGHAFERATGWHERRPSVDAQTVPLAPTPPDEPPADDAAGAGVDAATQSMVEALALRAGLALDGGQFAVLCEAAPYAFAMGRRLRRGLPWDAEMASVFRARSPLTSLRGRSEGPARP